MVVVYYFHMGRRAEYTKEFTDPYEARKFMDKMKHIGYYIVTYSCQLDYEFKIMERIYK